MKAIGFIDYYIDEWHANNYPRWIRESPFHQEIAVRYAWEEAPQKGRPLARWCQESAVEPVASIDEIVARSDALVVLAPSNPEVHQRLAEVPLQSGKPVYIDKPFADSLKTARALFELADNHHTPLMSCSALRFADQLLATAAAAKNITFAATVGGGSSFWEYSIHQVEMLVTLLGTGTRRVIQCGNAQTAHLIVEYGDERRACLTLDPRCGFTWQAMTDEKAIGPVAAGNFWGRFIDALLGFLISGESAIPRQQTLEIAALVETGILALQQPDQWVEVVQ